MLSAATETVANADAMEAAAMKASKLPTGPPTPAEGAAAGAAGAADAAETSTTASRTGSSEMGVDDASVPSRSNSKDNGAAPPPAVLPAVRAAHELLLKNAEDIKTGV